MAILSGTLYINGKDAYKEWGMFLLDTAVSALMTPPSIKESVSNSSRLQDGARIYTGNPRIDKREVSIPFGMTAKNADAFLVNYAALCEELAKGAIIIRTSYQPNVYYRCVYESCSQFSQFQMELAKFTLKLTEPDPTNRGANDKTATE